MREHTGQQQEVVRGTVERVTYRNADNGYSVLQVLDEGSGEPFTAVGICPQARVGSHVIMTGSFAVHPKFGKQFTLVSITETPPSTAEGIQRYLSSGLISGIGKKTAERIVSEFGSASLEVIKSDPDKVAKLSGVGRKKAEALSSALAQQTDFDQILRFLVEHNISPNLSAKIYERFKGKTVDTLRGDPYLLAREIRGIGFHTADQIARNIGIEPNSPKRIQAGLYFALTSASDEGHCYLSRAALTEKARLLLGIEDTAALQENLDAMLSQDLLTMHEGGVFLKNFDRAEDLVARFIAERALTPKKNALDPHITQQCIAEAERVLGVSLSPEQQVAVESAARYGLLIITGGPGCGKTTIIKALTLLFEQTGMTYALAAPTGRAAQRMSQVCSKPASTIHRLLKYDPMANNFVFNAKNTLPYDAIIIDEASMVDILLARDLFQAIPPRCTVILVGDKDQLPSVGPGRVFADLVGCKDVRVISLSKLFRRTEESHINSVAYMINTGEVPEIPTPDGVTRSDAYFIQREDSEEAARLVESLVAEQIPKKFGFSGTDIAVLTPSNRGPLGTIELNKRIQERLNPKASHTEKEILQVGDVDFRVGDRVCQRVNNYKIDPIGVYNGDMGTVLAVDTEDQRLSVELWDGRLIEYPKGEVSQLSLAYTVTVHRSQGMEVPCVVLVLDTSHFTLLERQLVYTGVTRAKKLLIVVGSKRALAIASKRAQTKKRCTMLLERIHRLTSPEQVRYVPLEDDVPPEWS
jgi:exodeoxyribonuclease V alpha subunit